MDGESVAQRRRDHRCMRRPYVSFAAALLLAGALPAHAQEPPTCFGQPATIVGTDGKDRIYGTPGPDVIVAGDGADSIEARGGDDLVCAGRGIEPYWDEEL